MLQDLLQFGIMYPLADQLLVGKDAKVRLDVFDLFRRRCCRAGRHQGALGEDAPRTAAVWATCFVFSGRRSMRALSTPVSVSGMVTFTISRVARQWLFSRTM